MGTHICRIDWHNNGWPWVTLNGRFIRIARYLCDSWASCYIGYRRKADKDKFWRCLNDKCPVRINTRVNHCRGAGVAWKLSYSSYLLGLCTRPSVDITKCAERCCAESFCDEMWSTRTSNEYWSSLTNSAAVTIGNRAIQVS